jgi:2-polyprenyl-6-methoxyphenol hydroxylase-like FAD-dependent oxidoreductase
MSEFDAIVAGAGVGGAALALALSRQGLRVLVLEMQPGPGTVNRGVSLLPAITRHLAAWGALERFYEAGATPVPKMQVFHHRDGLLMEAPFGDPGGHPYLVLPHPDIERVLAEAARATGRVTVRYRSRVGELVRRGGRVCGVEAVGSQGERQRFDARLVVGADGAFSAVRRLLGVGTALRRYDACFFGLDFERPAAYEEAMRLHLHPEGGLMIMPNRPGVVGAAVLVHARARELFKAGTLAAKVEAIRRRAEILRGGEPIPRTGHLYALFRAHADAYVREGAALIGDAAHVGHPTGGQGMTMAVEDAAALAGHVGPLLARDADERELEDGLRAYESQQRPRNAALLRWSHFLGMGFGLPGPAADLVRRRFFALCGTRAGQWVQRRVWSRMGTRPASRGPWIISARQDLLWFQGSVLAGLALLSFFAWSAPVVPGASLGQPALLALVLWGVLFDGTHVVGTYARSYLAPDSDSRAGLPGAWSWGLLAVGPAAALAGGGLFPYFLLGAYLWAYYHLVRQHWGFVALYRRRAGPGAGPARLDQALLWTAALHPYLRFSLTPAYAGSGLPLLVPAAAVAPLRLALDVAAVLLALALLGAWIRLAAARRLAPGPQHLLIAVVAGFHAVAFALLSDLLAIMATLTIFHNLQYHRIVWHYEAGKGRRPLGSWPLYLGAGLGLGLLWYGPRVVGAHLAGPSLLGNVCLGFGWGLAFHHYLVDGRIWRIRRAPGVARALEPAAAARAFALPAAGAR